MTTNPPSIRDEEIPTRGYRYLVFYGGGIGPDVWDAEREVYAVDIKDALAQCGDITDDGAWIISVEQSDYSKTTTKDQLAKAEAELIRLSAEREKELDSKAPTHRDINDIELIDDLKRTLAERDKELAEVKARLTKLEAALLDAEQEADDLESDKDELTAQLSEAQKLVGYERDAASHNASLCNDLRAQLAEVKAQNQTFRNAQKACEDCDAPTIAEFKSLKAQLLAAKAELAQSKQSLEVLTGSEQMWMEMATDARADVLKLKSVIEKKDAYIRHHHCDCRHDKYSGKLLAQCQRCSALSISPDTTLLDEVVRVLEMAYSREMDWDMLGRAHGNSTVQMWRRAAIDLLSRLRQSTRETSQ